MTTDSEGLAAYQQYLAGLARQSWSTLPQADVDAAVDAGMASFAGASGSAPGESGDMAAQRTATEMGRAAAAVQRQGLPPDVTTSVDWRGFGGILPVLAASPGAGASVVSAVLADALGKAGWRVLLADTADPARSGLSMAASSEGPVVTGPHPAVRLRRSWRGNTLLTRVETTLPVLAPGMVPPPRFWHPSDRALQVTVVDIGHDPWRVTAHPLGGAGAWLRHGQPMPRPLLVCRPTRPSLVAAEQVLARLQRWVESGVAAQPCQLVVVGAKKWPNGLVGMAGRRVSPLLEQAVFCPHEPTVAVAGVTDALTPARSQAAFTPLLRRWGLLQHSSHPSTNTSQNRKSR